MCVQGSGGVGGVNVLGVSVDGSGACTKWHSRSVIFSDNEMVGFLFYRIELLNFSHRRNIGK